METKVKSIVYTFGEFRLNPAEKLLLRGDEKFSLRPKTFALLVRLVENAGSLCEKQKLLDEIWEGTIVEEGNLNRTVSELRKLLGDTKGESQFIETIPRVGYRFIADVQTENLPEISSALNKSESTAPENETKPNRSYFRPAVYSILALTLLISVSLLVWTYSKRAKSLPKSERGEIQLTNDPNEENSAFWTKDGKIRYLIQAKEKPQQWMRINADGTEKISEDNKISPDGTMAILQEPGASFISNVDGSNKRKMPFVLGNMDWSPVANEIVAQYKLGKDNWELGIINLDTLQLTNITNSPNFDGDPSFSPDGQQIAMTSGRDGNAEIYLMNHDGSNVRRMTNNPAWESFASFSPDGTQLIFNSDRQNEKNNAYILNLDGSEKLTPLPTGNYGNFIGSHAWSPDGTKIVFSSDRNGNEDLFVIDAELTKPTPLVSDENADLFYPQVSKDGKTMIYLAQQSKDSFEIRAIDLKSKQTRRIYELSNETNLSLSPDGQKIIFQNKVADNTEICQIDIDGTNFKTVSDNPSADVAAVFSPNGKQIAFLSNRGGNSGVFQIFVMDAEGGNQQKITSENIAGTCLSPIWSPDGNEVYFANDREDGRNGNFEIFKIPANGGEPQRITVRPRSLDLSPAISADGKKVIFESLQKGNTEIYLMNIDGSGQLRITRNTSEDKNPIWSNDGTKIYFTSNRNGKFEIFSQSAD